MVDGGLESNTVVIHWTKASSSFSLQSVIKVGINALMRFMRSWRRQEDMFQVEGLCHYYRVREFAARFGLGVSSKD